MFLSLCNIFFGCFPSFCASLVFLFKDSFLLSLYYVNVVITDSHNLTKCGQQDGGKGGTTFVYKCTAGHSVICLEEEKRSR